MNGRVVIDFDYPQQIFAVPFLQMPNCGAFVSRMLEMLLKKLQASAILREVLLMLAKRDALRPGDTLRVLAG
jgi:hypothetical protein